MDASVKQYIIRKLKAWGFVLLYLVAWFAMVAIISTPLYFASSLINFGEELSFLFSACAMLLATLLLTWLFCKLIHYETLSEIGLGLLNRKWIDLLYGLLYGTAAITVGFCICYFAGVIQITGVSLEFATITNLGNIDSPSVKILRFLPSIILSFLTFVIVAFNEEIMFRGYILRRFMSGYNKYAALVISSILFMLMHGFNGNLTFLGLFNIFLAGVLLGMYYIHQQNLWFPIGLHFTWNFFQGPVFGFAVSGTTSGSIIKQQPISGEDWLTGGAFGFEGSVLCTLLIIVMIVAIHLQYHKKEILVSPVPEENHDVIN